MRRSPSPAWRCYERIRTGMERGIHTRKEVGMYISVGAVLLIILIIILIIWVF
jgi:hypothetical protein